MSPLARPSPPALKLLAGSGLVWLGAWSGRRPQLLPALAILVGLALAASPRKRWRLALAALAALCLGIGSGVVSQRAEIAIFQAELPSGGQMIRARVVTDPEAGRFGGESLLVVPRARLVGDRWQSWDGPPLLVRAGEGSGLEPAWSVEIEGTLLARPGMAAGRPYAGVLRASRLQNALPPTSPFWIAGNAIRRRILEQVGPTDDPPSALLAGFLVGHTAALTEVDLFNLRRSGLADFVAVSGSNVALFLGVWWIVLGPLGMGRRRVWFGLGALLVFAVVTRWEPSVVRAAAMAAVVLGGRRIGIPVDGWTALAVTVTGVLLASGSMADNAGFQLSVAATAGVMAGSRVDFGLPRPLGPALGATVCAQAAVLPLMLTYFDKVPVGAPIANLAAAPLVAISTITGGLGALSGLVPLLAVGKSAAAVVILISRVASHWPQLDAGQAAAAILGAGLAHRWRRHPLVVVAVLGGVGWAVLVPHAQVDGPAAVVLDVGQGDSILLVGSHNETALIDGGPDPEVVLDALARYRVEQIDLMVLTHVHEDHAAGLVGVVQSMPVSSFWSVTAEQTSPAWEELQSSLQAAGVPMSSPDVGTLVQLGDISIEVLGPARRYAEPNDQSIVLMVEAGGVSALLTGDIERFAQEDLGSIPADILKVPHHGGNTSDLSWLTGSVRRLAVISVGENEFGHPAPAVLGALEGLVPVLRTDQEGDVIIPLRVEALNLLVGAASG